MKHKAVQAGFSRSGSTMVWQIMNDLIGGGVCKTHTYADYEDSPVVVTVRSPFDCVASIDRVEGATDGSIQIAQDVGGEMLAFVEQHKGPLLVLKYEDWWPDMGEVITQCAKFLGVTINSAQYGAILLHRNLAANKKIADEQGEWKSVDAATMIHGKHIGTGRPGLGTLIPQPRRETIARRLDAFMRRFEYAL